MKLAIQLVLLASVLVLALACDGAQDLQTSQAALSRPAPSVMAWLTWHGKPHQLKFNQWHRPRPQKGPEGDPGPAPEPEPQPEPDPAPVCTDSDGGRDLFTKGSVAGTFMLWTGTETQEIADFASDDICVDFNVPPYGAAAWGCEAPNCSVYEYTCLDGLVQYEYVPCEFGCLDGACLSAPASAE